VFQVPLLFSLGAEGCTGALNAMFSDIMSMGTSFVLRVTLPSEAKVWTWTR